MSDNPSDLINWGERLFKQGNYQVAIGCFAQAAELKSAGGVSGKAVDACRGQRYVDADFTISPIHSLRG